MKALIKVACAAALALVFGTEKADAYRVDTRLGTFDIQVADPGSFNAANGATDLEAAPWWNQQQFDNGGVGGLARNFASNFFRQQIRTGAYMLAANESLAFAWSRTANGRVNTWTIVGDNDGNPNNAGNFRVANRVLPDVNRPGQSRAGVAGNSNGRMFVSYASGATAVPEIDGPVLAQVGFVLGGLYLMMLGRRRQSDAA